jgi:hypothetical protein
MIENLIKDGYKIVSIVPTENISDVTIPGDLTIYSKIEGAIIVIEKQEYIK